ncbi:competence protein ComEA [Saccharopolyspora lacisalsi]|uniref:Competence protein ComEA n=2 Tax=Halosaccharopolyspora lacisalsi TaxID=1000566 RepID=A0A839E3A8_9PSEU|nr:competence protein ComEA [Halosaccharopolyspora lacisalsi]
MAEAEGNPPERAESDDSPEPGATSNSVTPPTRLRRLVRRWLPESWLQSRVDPGGKGLLVIVFAGLVGAVVIVVTVWTNRPSITPAPPLPTLPSSSTAPASSSAAPRELVISVVGEVHRPGLVTVEPGSRVADALRAAGGALPDTEVTALNLARELTDGEQLYVGVPVPANARGSDRSPQGRRGAGTGTAKLDLNRASREDIEELPGVGPVTAKRILRWRREHERFTEVGQLREISGIGEVRFSRLREMVRV